VTPAGFSWLFTFPADIRGQVVNPYIGPLAFIVMTIANAVIGSQLTYCSVEHMEPRAPGCWRFIATTYSRAQSHLRNLPEQSRPHRRSGLFPLPRREPCYGRQEDNYAGLQDLPPVISRKGNVAADPEVAGNRQRVLARSRVMTDRVEKLYGGA